MYQIYNMAAEDTFCSNYTEFWPILPRHRLILSPLTSGRRLPLLCIKCNSATLYPSLEQSCNNITYCAVLMLPLFRILVLLRYIYQLLISSSFKYISHCAGLTVSVTLWAESTHIGGESGGCRGVPARTWARAFHFFGSPWVLIKKKLLSVIRFKKLSNPSSIYKVN